MKASRNTCGSQGRLIGQRTVTSTHAPPTPPSHHTTGIFIYRVSDASLQRIASGTFYTY